MRVSDMYPSEWLKYTDLIDGDQAFTIEQVSDTVFKGQDGKEKPQIVLHFHEIDKKLGLNGGNAGTLGKLFGDESDDWVSKRVVVGCAKARNGTNYVEVRELPTQAANRPKPRTMPAARPAARPAAPPRTPAPVMTQEEVDEDIDIPFDRESDVWPKGRQ